MTNLESDFKEELKKAIKEATAKINIKLVEANKLLMEAETISEEYGIPFHSSISPISQDYKPYSFNNKWEDYRWRNYAKNPKLNIYDLLLEENIELPDSEGWEYSRICY